MKALTIFLAFLGAAAAHGQSLLQEGGAGPYDPPKPVPYKKHDHIRILVVERTRALTSSELRTDRRSCWEVGLDDWIRFDTGGKNPVPRLRSAPLKGRPEINLEGRFRQDNLGRTTRRSDLTFTITAEIVDIRPNGNLVLQAMKHRKINADTETIKLTGEVSSKQVFNGQIRSEQVANLNVTYEASGTVGDTSKPGWLSWILNKLWPF